MRKVFNFNKEIPFEDNIASILSISLDCTYNETSDAVEGVFSIEGSYKTHELSLNKKDFKQDLKFNHEFASKVENSVNIEIQDFTYELEDNNIIINIDYELTYDEEIKEEFNEEEFERFLDEHEVDVVSLKDDEEESEDRTIEENSVCEEEIVESIPEETVEPASITPESVADISDVTIEEPAEEREETDVLLNNISKEENYITYHVHVCESDDTFESLCQKYNTTTEEIREYNEIEELKCGIKLIIPVKDEKI